MSTTEEDKSTRAAPSDCLDELIPLVIGARFYIIEAAFQATVSPKNLIGFTKTLESLQRSSDIEERMKKSVEHLERAAVGAGLSREDVIGLGQLFRNTQYGLLASGDEEYDREVKLSIDTFYFGMLHDADMTRPDLFFENLYDGLKSARQERPLSEELRATIESHGGTKAVELVKLGMSPEALTRFSAFLKMAQGRPRTRTEKRNFVLRAFIVATPLLKDSPQALELLAAVSRDITNRGEIFPAEIETASSPATAMKTCAVCARNVCRPSSDGYLESDLAGKPVGPLRPGASHQRQAENLAARAYAQVHALSIGPKTQFGRWICHDCVLDYWGVIKRLDPSPGESMKVIWDD